MASPPEADLGHCLVTGASGYLGSHLVAALHGAGHPVRAFDMREPTNPPPGVEVVMGDVCCFEDVVAACADIDTVFHTAALLVFLTFSFAAERRRVHRVNVEGVENMVRAASQAGVRRLVYTSSNNVTLDDPVVDGDESTPYARNPRDLYTETKILGEKAVLAANGRNGLLTCAIRPGGIYGPGDPLILPRVVEQMRRGRLVVVIGDPENKSDNTYIDNLVDGEITAARHLLPGAAACGQAYYITDGFPINYFEFFRPFVEGLGFRFPTRRIPAWPVQAVAWLGELLHVGLRLPAPPLTRLEARKITVSHYNRIDKAKRDLGWTPPVPPNEAARRCLPYCRELLAGAG